MKIMVSACLTGDNCKYNGGNNRNEKVLQLMAENEVITVCPEQMGGLPTPRVPSEIKDGVVTAKDGRIVDSEFRAGAAKCLEIALCEKPDLIILQSRSPSCGVKQRYDGSFTGTLMDGTGVTAEQLMDNSFRVIDVDDLAAIYNGVLIRKLCSKEVDLLKDFLYEAIFIPEGMEPPARNIVERPELRIYYDDFGQGPADYCLVAEKDGRIIGAVWTRIMNDYGHVDDETPSLAISLFSEYRGQGIGTRLMKEMLSLLKEHGYPVFCYKGQYRMTPEGDPLTYMLYGHVHNTHDERLVNEFIRITRSTMVKSARQTEEHPIPCNMINCFCMFSNYIPLTLDDWIKLDKERRERMNLE